MLHGILNVFGEKVESYNVKDKDMEKESKKILSNIIETAISKNVSDIHFESNEEICTIRFRIDGVLNMFKDISLKSYDEVLSIVKIKSNMDISKKFIPQDGNLSYKFKEEIYNLRTSTLPSIYKEKLVVRILSPKENIKLEDLGFSDKIQELKKISYKSRGIFLVSGPTGSGKSTTLKAIINSMDKDRKNIITIEDPVEYRITGVTQVSLNEKVNLGFKEALKSILRQDPDVIMVGEIRDEETAKIALRAAITGHLVLSTVHTYDSTSVITRLLDMKVPSYILLDGLSTVLSQRLIRKICPYCKTSYVLKENSYKELGLKEGDTLFKGMGCDKCNNTGYLGRRTVYEILELKDIHRNYISNHKDLTNFRDFCIKNNLITLKDMCISMLYEGITTLEEVYKVIL